MPRIIKYFFANCIYKLFREKYYILFILIFHAQCIGPVDTQLANTVLQIRLLSKEGDVCFIFTGTGKIQEGRLSNKKECIPVYTISGKINGLIRNKFILKTEDSIEIEFSVGAENYSVKVLQGSATPIKIKKQPLGLYCSFPKEISNIIGDITNFDITCRGLGGKAIGLLDTYVNSCFDNNSSTPCNDISFPLQDGDIISTFSQSFTENLDETVKDNTTGLVWKKCAEGYSGANCLSGSLIQSNLSSAMTLCSNGFRLPTIQELATIHIYGDGPAVKRDPIFTNFPVGNKVWSQSQFGSNAYYIDSGISKINEQSFTLSDGVTHCVKEISPIEYKYQDLGNGIIEDTVSGLQWEKCIQGQIGISCSGLGIPLASWSDALNYCSSLVIYEKEDWRLPNINELTSLVNFSNISTQKLDPLFENQDVRYPFYSSTTFPAVTSTSISINFDPLISGAALLHGKSTFPSFARCVRGPD